MDWVSIIYRGIKSGVSLVWSRGLMELPATFWIGLILGGIGGSIVGFLLGMASGFKEKKLIKKENKAEKLFNLATQEESQERKRELLGKVLDKYPRSEWADKALEESMRMRK